MTIIPALDIINGSVVRLQKGDFSRQTNYTVSPIDQAKKYESAGGKWLHLVDLDGARAQKPVNLDILSQIADQTNLKIQAGGGIRTEKDMENLFSAGANRIVIGSLAFKNPNLVSGWIDQFGADKICLACDVRLDEEGVPFIATGAWESTTEITLWDAMRGFQSAGVRHILCTDIGRDGELAGPNVKLYQTMIEQFPDYKIQASGGVSALNDLAELKSAQLAGVIIGKALLEERFTVQEALKC